MPPAVDRFDPGPKVYTIGTDRSRRPDETLAAVAPHLADLGITRVANVTGLDRIGIPVHMVVRPNSRSLAVSQGKGTELVASKVSGIMESIELHWAERYSPPVSIARFVDLVDSSTGPTPVDPELLAQSRDTRYSPYTPIPWVEASDLVSSRPCLVPLEMVYADATLPELPGSGCFVRSTNGLASGNTISEAVLSALCEVVERDAEAIWRHLPADARGSRRLDLATIDDPLCRQVLDQYSAADITVVVWDITSDIGLPAFRCVIVDNEADDDLRPMPAAYGAGCHPRREVALVRALTEAAQSRLTTISGTRDDLVRARYRSTQSQAAQEANRQLADGSGRAPFGGVDSVEGETIRDDITTLLERLVAVGVPSVAAVSMAPDDAPYCVARVVLPGLEGPTESPAYRPGPRAKAAGA